MSLMFMMCSQSLYDYRNLIKANYLFSLNRNCIKTKETVSTNKYHLPRFPKQSCVKLYDSRCSKRMIIHLRDTYITRIVFLLNHSKRYNSTGRINCFKLYGSLNTKGDTLIAYRLPITFSFTFTAGSPSFKKVMFIVYSCSP